MKSTLQAARADDILELDEMWSFVQRRKNQVWLWIALCRRTGQVVAYYTGDRSKKSCKELWERIPADYRSCYSFSDFWEAYREVFSPEFHICVGKESGQTSHIERFNNTIRQRIGRYVRKTLSFSKSTFFHNIVMKLFIHKYNLALSVET